MPRFSELREHATPEQASVPLCLDRSLLARFKDAERKLEEAEAETDEATGRVGEEVQTRIAQTRDEVEALRKEAEDKTATYVFESIGRRRWSDLLAEHPPTPEQKKQFGEMQGFNEETFVPAAIAASCVEPELTVEDAEFLQEFLTEGVWNRLVGALFSVNVVGSRDPFGNSSDGALHSVLR